jgi:hypothetical protein
VRFSLGFFHLAVVEQARLLDEQPGVQARMLAFGRNFLAFEIRNLVDAGIGTHHETMIQQADGLSEVNPFIAGRPADVGREMIAADEFHRAVGNVLVRILGSDLVIVIHIQAMFCPGAGFMNYVQERQVAVGTIGKVYFIHGASSSLTFSLVEAFGGVNLFC